MDATGPTQVGGGYYYGWNVLAVGMLFQAIVFGTIFFSFTLWVEPWMQTFGVARGDIMATFLGIQLMMGVLGPFAGRAMDVLPIRGLVIAGALCFAAGLWLVSQATALWQIAALYGSLYSLGALLAGPMAAQTLVARWFRARRGAAIGLSAVGTSLGGVAIPLLVGWLLLNFDWRMAHQALAVLTLVGIVPIVWLVVRNSPEAAGVTPEADSALTAGDAHWPAWTTRKLLTNRSFYGLALIITPMVATAGAIQQNFAPFATDQQVAPATIATLVSAFALAMAFGKLCFGTLADRVDHRVLFAIATALLLVTLLLLQLPAQLVVLGMVSCTLGLGAGGVLPLIAASVAARFGPAAFGRVMGLLAPFTACAAAGPLAAGYLRDSTGSYSAAWTVFLGVVSLSLLALALLGPRQQPEEAAEFAAGHANN